MRRSATVVLVSLMYTHSYAQAHLTLPGSGYGDCDSSNMASIYVPIESWIYPAIERLALAGYIGAGVAAAALFLPSSLLTILAGAAWLVSGVSGEGVNVLLRAAYAEVRRGRAQAAPVVDAADWRP